MTSALEYPNNPVICILGPTASGKSALSERLACHLDGEIISADSMQIYKGMDIGTAKQPIAQRSVAYHCIDILAPGEPYSASLFQRDSRAAIDKINASGHVPLICGGTFFYVRACLNNMDFAPGAQQDNPVREKYQAYLQSNGADALYALLAQADPKSAGVIHPNNTVRVIRALEMCEVGESYAARKEAFTHIPQKYASIKIALDVERETLYERINVRVDEMVEQGLVSEVEGLLEKGFREACTASAAIGYKEVVDYLDGHCTFEESVDAIKQATRRYSKRQRSWLRGEPGVVWLDATEYDLERLEHEALEIITDYSLS